MSRPHLRFTIAWMAIVGISALILTPITLFLRMSPESRSSALAGVMIATVMLVIFSPTLVECYKRSEGSVPRSNETSSPACSPSASALRFHASRCSVSTTAAARNRSPCP